MASILERRKKEKIPKKTIEDHAEDALYREISEEVHAEKTLEFVRKNSRLLIAAAVALVVAVSGWQLWRHQHARNLISAARLYENAQYAAGDAAETAYLRVASQASGGMADLALFDAAAVSENPVPILERLAARGDTRDFRDLARIKLAGIRGDAMSADEFAKFMSPLQTKRSPFYFTGLLMVAQKYIAAGDKAAAARWLDKIISDSEAPATISGLAATLK